MFGYNISSVSGFGVILENTVVDAASDLSTVPVEIELPDVGNSGPQRLFKVKIVNPNETNVLAWCIVGENDPDPTTMTADFSSTSGSHILPSQAEIFSFPANKRLFLVASAGSSSYSVTIASY